MDSFRSEESPSPGSFSFSYCGRDASPIGRLNRTMAQISLGVTPCSPFHRCLDHISRAVRSGDCFSHANSPDENIQSPTSSSILHGHEQSSFDPFSHTLENFSAASSPSSDITSSPIWQNNEDHTMGHTEENDRFGSTISSAAALGLSDGLHNGENHGYVARSSQAQLKTSQLQHEDTTEMDEDDEDNENTTGSHHYVYPQFPACPGPNIEYSSSHFNHVQQELLIWSSHVEIEIMSDDDNAMPDPGSDIALPEYDNILSDNPTSYGNAINDDDPHQFSSSPMTSSDIFEYESDADDEGEIGYHVWNDDEEP